MQDPFTQKKQKILSEISANGTDNLDASPKGTIDEHCLPIIHLINSHPDMVTTSSCSGRVSVYLEGTQDKLVSKGNEGKWIFVTHEPAETRDWYKTVDFEYGSRFPSAAAYGTRGILYKFEALILHVKCRDLQTSNQLYSLAMSCGFRESGIGSNFNVAIRISIKLDVPIGFLDEDTGKYACFVGEEYLEYLTKLSLDRFEENFRKLKQLYDAIEKYVAGSDGAGATSENKPKDRPTWESKEERRERMMKEGLKRREELRRD
ncbi:uncharacterized protein LODBEIA_P08460 [Lodderomyces beijingensis]|uniref:tRNA(Phe) 7-[(3-amino-3-carboxypropyl)-4-demethylwyosine(37)-N(4)]-methyltransferase n=1 Tax=Lodderomyces beijingensis TaxID=1775926 RepID=A0ABP0ZGU1_9ASCO